MIYYFSTSYLPIRDYAAVYVLDSMANAPGIKLDRMHEFFYRKDVKKGNITFFKANSHCEYAGCVLFPNTMEDYLQSLKRVLNTDAVQSKEFVVIPFPFRDITLLAKLIVFLNRNFDSLKFYIYLKPDTYQSFFRDDFNQTIVNYVVSHETVEPKAETEPESKTNTSDIRFSVGLSIDELSKEIDEREFRNIDVAKQFRNKLFSYIELSGLKESEVYHRANIDKRLFSKIRLSEDYSPSKNTVIALCFGLQLSLNDSLDLLNSAGYTLSNTIKKDLVVKAFIDNGFYNLDMLNLFLYERDLPQVTRY